MFNEELGCLIFRPRICVTQQFSHLRHVRTQNTIVDVGTIPTSPLERAIRVWVVHRLECGVESGCRDHFNDHGSKFRRSLLSPMKERRPSSVDPWSEQARAHWSAPERLVERAQRLQQPYTRRGSFFERDTGTECSNHHETQLPSDFQPF